MFTALVGAVLYLARWNTSDYWSDTAHFIQVYRSLDNGSSWEFLANVGHNGQGYITSDFGLGITYDVATGNLYMIALCHYYEHTAFVGTEVFRSTDGGYTWESIHDFGVNYSYSTYDYATAGITHDPFDGHLFCYFFQESPYIISVQESSDGGYTWTEISTLPPGGGSDLEGEMLVGPGGVLWIGDWFGTYPTCYVSTDAGQSWSSHIIAYQTNSVSARSVALAYLQPNLYALTWTTESPGRLYMSSDGGYTWSYVSTVLGSRASDDGSCALVAQFGYLIAVFWDASHQCSVYRSSDGGITWQHAGDIPRPEPWYAPASAVSITTDRPPLALNESRQNDDLIVVSAKGGLVLLTRGGETSVRIYGSDGRFLKEVWVRDRARVDLEPGVYYLTSGLASKIGVVP